MSQDVKPLIWVECQVEKHSRSRTEYLVKARSQFKERSAATSVEIMLPLPADAITPVVRTSQVRTDPFNHSAGNIFFMYYFLFIVDLNFTFISILQGSATYAPEKDALVWKIKNFPGGKEFLLRCKFGLPSVEAEEESKGRMPPIKVKFEVPYFTVSGIQVRNLPCYVKFE